MSLITAATATQLTLGLSARCTFITRAAWTRDGHALILAHGNGLSVWIGGFEARPNHVFATEAPVRAVATSPLGPLAAVGGHDGAIRLWNTDTWQRDRAMPVQMHKSAVTALRFHPRRAILASGDGNGQLYQVDLDSGRFMKLGGHAKEVTSVAYSPDGALLATGSWDDSAKLWSATTGALLQTLEHPDWVRWLAFSPGDGALVTAGRDGLLREWSPAEGALRRMFEAHTGGMDTLAYSPDGSLLATGGRDGALRLWDAAALAPLHTVEDAHAKPLLTLAFRPQGDFLISGGGDNWAHLWEIPAAAEAAVDDEPAAD